MAKKKPLDQYKAGYYKACLALCESGFKNPQAAQKILNIRVHVANITSLEEFEAGLVAEWNLPANLFKNIEELAKDSVVAQVKKEVGFDDEDRITDSEYIEAVCWMEKAYDINTWEELDNFNEPFHILYALCRSSKYCKEYMKSFLNQIQEDIWNEEGIHYTLENTTIRRLPNGDFTPTTIQLWQRAYKILSEKAPIVYEIAQEHDEFVDLPKYLRS